MIPQPGQRIRIKSWKPGPPGALSDENETVPPGTEGTVERVSNPAESIHKGQVWVHFDNGANLAMLVGEDEWEVLDGS